MKFALLLVGLMSVHAGIIIEPYAHPDYMPQIDGLPLVVSVELLTLQQQFPQLSYYETGGTLGPLVGYQGLRLGNVNPAVQIVWAPLKTTDAAAPWYPTPLTGSLPPVSLDDDTSPIPEPSPRAFISVALFCLLLWQRNRIYRWVLHFRWHWAGKRRGFQG